MWGNKFSVVGLPYHGQDLSSSSLSLWHGFQFCGDISYLPSCLQLTDSRQYLKNPALNDGVDFWLRFAVTWLPLLETGTVAEWWIKILYSFQFSVQIKWGKTTAGWRLSPVVTHASRSHLDQSCWDLFPLLVAGLCDRVWLCHRTSLSSEREMLKQRTKYDFTIFFAVVSPGDLLLELSLWYVRSLFATCLFEVQLTNAVTFLS